MALVGRRFEETVRERDAQYDEERERATAEHQVCAPVGSGQPQRERERWGRIS
jgi:hypothetical protein